MLKSLWSKGSPNQVSRPNGPWASVVGIWWTWSFCVQMGRQEFAFHTTLQLPSLERSTCVLFSLASTKFWQPWFDKLPGCLTPSGKLLSSWDEFFTHRKSQGWQCIALTTARAMNICGGRDIFDKIKFQDNLSQQARCSFQEFVSKAAAPTWGKKWAGSI